MSRAETGSHTRQKIQLIPRNAYWHLQTHVQHIENTCFFIMDVNSMTKHKTLRESCPYSSGLRLFSLPAAVNSIIIYITIAYEGVCIHRECTTLTVCSTQIQTHTLIHNRWSPLRCQQSAHGLVEPLFRRAHIL